MLEPVTMTRSVSASGAGVVADSGGVAIVVLSLGTGSIAWAKAQADAWQNAAKSASVKPRRSVRSQIAGSVFI
jgi:hypothetical protein